jgi:hypothetical protein
MDDFANAVERKAKKSPGKIKGPGSLAGAYGRSCNIGDSNEGHVRMLLGNSGGPQSRGDRDSDFVVCARAGDLPTSLRPEWLDQGRR